MDISLRHLQGLAVEIIMNHINDANAEVHKQIGWGSTCSSVLQGNEVNELSCTATFKIFKPGLDRVILHFVHNLESVASHLKSMLALRAPSCHRMA